jgi:osmoprotectant transport system substrate-binding protein
MRIAAACLALLVGVALASCGGDDAKPKPKPVAGGPPVRIGTKNFTESEILGELYRQALEAKGFRVELRSSVGPTELIDRALRGGLLDMYPEYVGILLSVIDDVQKPPASAEAAYRLAKAKEERRGFTLLDQTSLSDENALAVTASFARRHRLRSIADLEGLRPAPRLVAAPEFKNRIDGMIGLRRLYGLTSLKLQPLAPGEQYHALDGGTTDVAAVFTTDPPLASGRYALLRDTKGVFAKQHVAPVISEKVLSEHGPSLATALNAVSALLTTPVMRVLNGQVGGAGGRTPRQVADEFLREHGLK